MPVKFRGSCIAYFSKITQQKEQGLPSSSSILMNAYE